MVPIIAFDGLNRCGKGTQTELLRAQLCDQNIFPVVIRGDGSREGLGKCLGDPSNEWWRTFRHRLSGPEGTKAWYDSWNEAACVLAREMIHWKNVIMPALVEKSRYPRGVLIVDRSLISRIMVMKQANEYNGLKSLYTICGVPQGISWIDVRPDILFNFHVSYDELVSRLDPGDPKYRFRREMIERHYGLHSLVSDNLPKPIMARTINLEGDQDSGKIFFKVADVVKQFLNDSSVH